MVKVKKLSANPVECSLCKYVVAYVDAVIQTNKSEAAIDSALEKVCTILPHSINESCVKLVDQYGPVLVELIAKDATPSVVCNALKLCQNGTVKAETIARKFYF
jgi:saposin